MKSIPPQCCASQKEVPSPSNAPTTHFPGSHIRWRCAFLSDPMDTEELLQEVFKKICTDAADYDLRRWLGQLRFTRRHQASH